jgi:hypothetical protein
MAITLQTELKQLSDGTYILEKYKNTNYVFDVLITDKSETALDLTGKTTTFKVKKYSDSTELIDGTCTNLVQTGTTKGHTIFNLTRTHTLTTLGVGTWQFSILYAHSVSEAEEIRGKIVIA